MSVVKFTDYEVADLDFETIPGPTKKKLSQSILFPTYMGGRSPMIQIPKVEISTYGIPTKCEFFKEDYQRQFLKIPLDSSNPEVVEFMKWLQQIDEKMNKKDMKEKIFSKKNPKCTYQTLLRVPMTEDGKPKADRLPYLKVKLTSKYPTNEITTSVVIQRPDGSKEIAPDVHTVDDVASFVRYRSKIKCVIMPSKLWIIPPSGGDAAYGISFKLVKVLVELPPEKVITTESILDGFVDSDKED